MVILEGRAVRFRLSPEGKIALKDLFDKDSFQAFVERVDDLGAWILVGPDSPLILLKWDYFATAVVDYVPPAEPERRIVGFEGPHS